MKSYYDILGVTAEATQDDLQVAHRRKSQETVMNTEEFEEVQEAYDALQTPEKRADYDRVLALAAVKAQELTQGMPAQPFPARKAGTMPLRRGARAVNIDAPPTSGVPLGQEPFVSGLALGREPLHGDHAQVRAVQCPICGQQNVPTEVYCVECGFLLGGASPAGTPTGGSDELVSRPRLEDRDGRFYPLKPGLNRVGRENADILLRDKTVSRYHAMVVYDEERQIFSVEDAGSSNGTRVNQEPLAPRTAHAVKPGDQVEFGSFNLRLLAGDPPDASERTLIGGAPMKREPTLPPVALQPPVGRLRLLRGRGPQEVGLRPGLNRIGRLPDNNISLANDRYVSGHHAQVVVESTVFRLIDVGSTNGTYLNGLRLTTNELIAMSDGDEIMIGSNIFQFQKIMSSERAEIERAEAASLENPPGNSPIPPIEQLSFEPDLPPGEGEL